MQVSGIAEFPMMTTKMTTKHILRSITGCCKLVAVAVLLLAGASAAGYAQNVVALVNGEPITGLDLDHRMKFILLSTQKTPNREQTLEELIDEKLKIREGKRWGNEVSDEEVNSSYANMSGRMRQTADQLTQNLAKQGINANTLKSRIKAEITWNQLIRGRYSPSLQVNDKDVEAILKSKNIEDTETTSIDFILNPILFLVPPGSAPTVAEGRRKEADALRARFKSCEEGLAAARAMRDVTVRTQIKKNSGDIPAEYRKILDAIPIGQLTAPEVTRHGVELFAVCDKQESKTETSAKKQAREIAFTTRFEQLSKQYIRRLRAESLIERKLNAGKQDR
jgi:peptidyl-prolyl cis-trans isomerase SurA